LLVEDEVTRSKMPPRAQPIAPEAPTPLARELIELSKIEMLLEACEQYSI
jgi:hypothetical protein